MLMRMIIPFVCMFLVSFSASADERNRDDIGWYVGAVFGNTSTRTESKDVFDQVFIQKEDASGYGVYAGYNFTEWFGLEEMIIQTEDVANDRTYLTSADYFGVLVTPKFTFRFSEISSVYVKVGLAWLEYQENYDGNFFVINRYDEERWYGFASTVGVGVQFDLTKSLKCRLSYDRISGTLRNNRVLFFAPLDDVDVELDLASVGLHYQF